MLIRKVRGKEALAPVLMTPAEYELVKRLGVDLETYVKNAIREVAKRRRWTWWLKRNPE